MLIDPPSRLVQFTYKEHVAALTGAGAVACALLAPVCAPAVLGLVGFGAAGPIAGQLRRFVDPN